VNFGSFGWLNQESSLAFLGTADPSESELSLLRCAFLALSDICEARIHETHYGHLTWILAIQGGRLRVLFCQR
jgi:hypothetical protein